MPTAPDQFLTRLATHYGGSAIEAGKRHRQTVVILAIGVHGDNLETLTPAEIEAADPKIVASAVPGALATVAVSRLASITAAKLHAVTEAQLKRVAYPQIVATAPLFLELIAAELAAPGTLEAQYRATVARAFASRWQSQRAARPGPSAAAGAAPEPEL
jgi:hypothetical protein